MRKRSVVAEQALQRIKRALDQMLCFLLGYDLEGVVLQEAKVIEGFLLVYSVVQEDGCAAITAAAAHGAGAFLDAVWDK